MNVRDVRGMATSRGYTWVAITATLVACALAALAFVPGFRDVGVYAVWALLIAAALLLAWGLAVRLGGRTR